MTFNSFANSQPNAFVIVMLLIAGLAGPIIWIILYITCKVIGRRNRIPVNDDVELEVCCCYCVYEIIEMRMWQVVIHEEEGRENNVGKSLCEVVDPQIK
jgi:hypothetical protein